MIIAINYADQRFRKPQKLNSETALLHGADKVIEYGPEDIDSDFYKENEDILKQKRGNGYWLWKPYIIKKTLEQMAEGEYLIYSDAGAYYINDIDLLIECLEAEQEEIMVFTQHNHAQEKVWSKRDAFVLMGCDTEEYTDTPQALAGFMLVKKTDYTYQFIAEWLGYAQDARIITDQENCMGKENYPGFRENRHDQTILSLLSKKYRMRRFRDPSRSVAENDKEILDRSTYPQIFDLHRMQEVGTVQDVENNRREQLDILLEQWKTGKNVILYGAGKNARKLITYFRDRGLEVNACIVSDNQTISEQNVLGVRIYPFSKLPYNQQNTVVIVTVVNAPEICENLEKNGYAFICVNGKMIDALNRLIKV